FLHERRTVALVESEIVARGADLIAEKLVRPLELPHQRFRVRIENELVRIEAMALRGLVRAVHAIGIDGAGARVGKVAVPDLIGVFGQDDALELALACGVEKTKLDFRRVRREQREIDAEAVPRGA